MGKFLSGSSHAWDYDGSSFERGLIRKSLGESWESLGNLGVFRKSRGLSAEHGI